MFRIPEGTDGPTFIDYMYLPWGNENLEKFMPIEDWCVAEALRHPRTKEACALRAEFHGEILPKWMERDRRRVRDRLPPDPTDPRPRMEPQAPKVAEMRLGRVRNVKQNTLGSAFKSDAGRAMVNDMAHGVSKLELPRIAQDTIRGGSRCDHERCICDGRYRCERERILTFDDAHFQCRSRWFQWWCNSIPDPTVDSCSSSLQHIESLVRYGSAPYPGSNSLRSNSVFENQCKSL